MILDGLFSLSSGLLARQGKLWLPHSERAKTVRKSRMVEISRIAQRALLDRQHHHAAVVRIITVVSANDAARRATTAEHWPHLYLHHHVNNTSHDEAHFTNAALKFSQMI